MPETDEICTTLLNLPNTLKALLAPFDPAVLRSRPAEDEWSPLEVIGHLIASDSAAFRDRIHSIVHGHGVIPPFEPWDAIKARDFNAEPLAGLLDELRSERRTSVELLKSLTPEDLIQTGRFIDGYSDFAASDFVYEWCFHDQDHLQQILDATKLRYLRHMTRPMYTALVHKEPAER